MAEGTLSRWAAVRQMLSTYAEEAGYLSLQTYHSDRSGEQVGHFEVTPSFIARWLPDKSHDSGAIDLDLATVTPDDEPEDNEDEDGKDQADTGEAPGNATQEAKEEDGEDFPEAPEDEVEPVDPVDPVALVNAVRSWLYETCEDNTPPGETQRFRLRIHSPKGARQLWSSILDYDSGKEKPREKREPIELTSYTRKPVSDEPDGTLDDSSFDPPSPSERFLSGDEIAFSELLMEHHEDDDLLDFTNDIPTSFVEDELSFPQSASPSIPVGAEVLRRPASSRKSMKRGPSTPKGAPSQAIQSLMHLHKSHKEFIDTVMATTKQLVKVQAGAMDQLSGTLGDARNRENDLIQVIQGLRIAEAESAVDAAKAQDASQVRAVLGKEAIAQMGLLGQVLLNRPRIGGEPTGPSNGASNGVAPLLTGEEPVGELEAPDNGAHLYPDVSRGVELPISEEEQDAHEAEMVALLGWAENRPDVLDALNDPAVRNYLRNRENVEQLRTLAQMFGGTPAVEAAPPIPVDLQNGVEATPETNLDPETLEPTTPEDSTDENND
jgi:hypothetical protein